MISHVLDTSALLAHFQNEPGASEITDLLARGPAQIAISVLSLIEFKTRLHELVPDRQEVERLFCLYTETLSSSLATSNEVALEAIKLREAIRPRLPLADAIIAATAKVCGAILVHRDPHLAAIPQTELKQIVLPKK